MSSIRGERVLVLGTGDRARHIAKQVEAHPAGPIVVGFLDDDPQDSDREQVGALYRGDLDRLGDCIRSEGIRRVVFGLPRRYLGEGRIAHAIGVCELMGVELTIPLDLFDTRIASLVAHDTFGFPAVTHSVSSHRGPFLLGVKRAMDVGVSAVLLVVLLPLFVAIAVAVLVDSPGPVLFVQERCGLRGRRFSFLKFRTMVNDAEQLLVGLRSQNELSGPVFKMESDPRITTVGAWLRRYSLDELPQLLNVLVGQMSLVGPRPPIPEEVELYRLDHVARLSMRPGITCLWQVSGRNQIQFEDWVKLDLDYIERWSLQLDLKILAATIPAVISGRGAS